MLLLFSCYCIVHYLLKVLLDNCLCCWRCLWMLELNMDGLR